MRFCVSELSSQATCLKMSDSSDEEILVSAAALIFAASAKKKRRRTHRRCWVSKMNRSRPTMGAFHTTLAMIEVADCQTTCFKEYRQYLRFTEPMFTNLLQKVQDFFSKQETYFRQPISLAERLSVILRYLATGYLATGVSVNLKWGSPQSPQ